MSWRCATCDKLFETIPEDAVLLTKGAFSTVTVYRFADGEVHCLRRFMPMRLETKHKAFHKTKKVVGCEFCFPPPEPPKPEPPVEQVELFQAVMAALAELPEPQPELPVEVLAELPEVREQEIEDESESVTTMGAAFKRLGK